MERYLHHTIKLGVFVAFLGLAFQGSFYHAAKKIALLEYISSNFTRPNPKYFPPSKIKPSIAAKRARGCKVSSINSEGNSIEINGKSISGKVPVLECLTQITFPFFVVATSG